MAIVLNAALLQGLPVSPVQADQTRGLGRVVDEIRDKKETRHRGGRPGGAGNAQRTCRLCRGHEVGALKERVGKAGPEPSQRRERCAGACERVKGHKGVPCRGIGRTMERLVADQLTTLKCQWVSPERKKDVPRRRVAVTPLKRHHRRPHVSRDELPVNRELCARRRHDPFVRRSFWPFKVQQ